MSESRLLIQAIGNPSRGDDALGPLFVAALEESALAGRVESEWVYQLQVEQAEQWSHFDVVVVVDAHANLNTAFQWSELKQAPNAELGISSHQVSPETVLALNRAYFSQHPQVFQLALQAENFDLGAEITPRARLALSKGLEFLTSRLTCNESTCSLGGHK